jgi:hypothetical protein
MTLRRALAALLLVTATTLALTVEPAAASCHAFQVSAAPATVQEGKKVVVTVTRDGALEASNVRVSTVAGSATSGQDFSALDTDVAFANNSLSKAFTVAVTDDPRVEPAETFKLHLSDPGGCLGSGYSLGPDATVTIAANDTPAPTTTARPTTTTASTTSSTTSTTVASTTTSSETTTTQASSTTESSGPDTTELAAEPASDDTNMGLVALLVLGIIAIGTGGGYLLYRLRGGGGAHH